MGQVLHAFYPNRISANRRKIRSGGLVKVIPLAIDGLNELRGAIELIGVTHGYVQ